MKEYQLDEEYKLVKIREDRNIWDVYQNDELLPDRVDTLYKFYSLTPENLDSLFRHYFYLSKPISFNDPFDCNINLLKGTSGKEKMKITERNNVQNFGICCLSETIDNHLMWAHYTSNYMGFALQFGEIQVDIRREDYKQFALTRMIYLKNPPKIDQSLPFSHQYYISAKFKHWEYEKEWRISTDLNTDSREMSYPSEIVSGIYIGHKIPDKKPGLYKMLLEIQETVFPKASIYVVYPHPNDLNLKFEKVWN